MGASSVASARAFSSLYSCTLFPSAQLREVAYAAKRQAFPAEVPVEGEADEERLHLEDGENLLELQIVGATLSPPALELLGEAQPSTFCTYAFFKFETHCTPVVMGPAPKYGFTSRYVVNMDEDFLEYVRRGSVCVELHQKLLGCNWRTVAASCLPLRQLLEQNGRAEGSVPLAGEQAKPTGDSSLLIKSETAGVFLFSGSSAEVPVFGSLDYWFGVKRTLPKVVQAKAVDAVPSALSGSRWNDLRITVQRCSGLQPRGSQPPSPYVVFRFLQFPDCPTTTIHSSCEPRFSETKSYSVCMDAALDGYLRRELIQFYVFDFKEQEMDVYLGKARIALLPLAQDQEISGEGNPGFTLPPLLCWLSALIILAWGSVFDVVFLGNCD